MGKKCGRSDLCLTDLHLENSPFLHSCVHALWLSSINKHSCVCGGCGMVVVMMMVKLVMEVTVLVGNGIGGWW